MIWMMEYLLSNGRKPGKEGNNFNEMEICELTIVFKPFKRKRDGKMLSKKRELKEKYNEWVGRLAPVFNYHNVDEHIVYWEHDVWVVKNDGTVGPVV